MKNICVYCGSASGNSQEYTDWAKAFGTACGKAGKTIIYGGASIGIMGTIADACLSAGGNVIGIIPEHIVRREVAHKNLTQLIQVNSMHERKALMEQMSDAFVALPGGFGTLDELCEILTWRQLGLHQKPVYLANLNNYFSGLLEFTECAYKSGFISKEHSAYLQAKNTLPELLSALNL